MLYFIPDWEDRLDPGFDFAHDCYSSDRDDPYEHDIYAHQIFREPPYDGILTSLSLFQSKIRLKNNKGHYSIRSIDSIGKYLKINDKRLRTMGDCGAFNYSSEKEPPFSTEYVFKVYQNLDFDFGVSVDHLIFDSIFIETNGRREKYFLSSNEKEERRLLTLRNAEDFLHLHQEESPKFTPIGVAQGYSEKTYYDSVDKLINMGYTYIGIGALVRSKTEEIISILEKLYPLVNRSSRRIKLHLFGVLRQKSLKRFVELGVCSLDSASFLRKAWLRSTNNYFGIDGNWYSAIRVPQSCNPKVKETGIKMGITENALAKKEQECLRALHAYGGRKLENIDMLLDIIVDYDKLLVRNSKDGEGLREKYRKTLESRIWEKCHCEICENIGIHVVIFRGANRNKRRGFHNTKVFYDKHIKKI